MSLKSIALRIGQAVLVIWATFTLFFHPFGGAAWRRRGDPL